MRRRRNAATHCFGVAAAEIAAAGSTALNRLQRSTAKEDEMQAEAGNSGGEQIEKITQAAEQFVDYWSGARPVEEQRRKHGYLAKLAGQAERYDEMADHMESIGKAGNELSVEERNSLAVAFKNAVMSRRDAWRIMTSVELQEKSEGHGEYAAWAREYSTKMASELQQVCNTILGLLEQSLIPKASGGEA